MFLKVLHRFLHSYLSPLKRFQLLSWHNYWLNCLTFRSCCLLFLWVGLIVCLVGKILLTRTLYFWLIFPHTILTLRVTCWTSKQSQQLLLNVFCLNFLIFILILLLKNNGSQTFGMEAMINIRNTNTHTIKKKAVFVIVICN